MRKEAKGNTALLKVAAQWQRQDRKVLLNEQTTFRFRIVGNDLLIDRETKLTATDTTVVFKDIKDGLMAIRVARELEMPSNGAANFTDDKGNITHVPKVSNEGITGMYYASNGLIGDSVWSSKGTWVKLTGNKDGRDITIAIIDHPSNPGFPAYWHARGYGLFAINPLGRAIFSNGKEVLNLTLAPKQSTTFKYRLIVRSGTHITNEEMDAFSIDYRTQ